MVLKNSPAQISRVAAAQTGKVQPGWGKPFLRKSEIHKLALDAISAGGAFKLHPDGTIEVSVAKKEQPDDLESVRMK